MTNLESEVTLETEVMSVGRLVGGCRNIKEVTDVWVYQTSLQMQAYCYISQELDKNSGRLSHTGQL